MKAWRWTKVRNAAGLVAALVAILTGLAAPGSARAMVVARSFEQLVGAADAVVLARVTGERPFRAANADTGRNRLPIYTDVRFAVLQVLKGSRPSALIVTTPGGAVGDTAVTVSEAARFRSGATYVLALDAGDHVIGARYGAFGVEGGRVARLGQDWGAVRARIGRLTGRTLSATAGVSDAPSVAASALTPAIAAMSPGRVPAGVATQTVTITGSGFGTAAGFVTFPQTNGHPPWGTIVSWSDTSVVAAVPIGADSGNVTLTTADAQASLSYPYEVGYSYTGRRLPTPSITFRIDPNTADLADPTAAVIGAMEIWNSVPDSAFRYLYGGACSSSANPPLVDGYDDIYFASSGFEPGVLAWNWTYYVGDYISESDIVVNDAYAWVDGAVPGAYDLRSVLAHEMGHSLSLDDQYGSADAAKLMYGQMGTGSTKRTLSTWDIEGIRYIYGTVGPVVPIAVVTRTGGADRYAVAATLAGEAFPGFVGTRDVVIACGSDRAAADPLSAAGLAGVYDAPVLLVQNDSRIVVPAATLQVLAAMKAANGALSIHVVGGPASVTAGHVRVLASYGTVDRIGGADRYAVAAGVAERMRSRLGPAFPRTAIVTNGNIADYFFNALAASPVAFRGHYPILLVKNGSVPPATSAALSSYSTRYVVGDTTAVSAVAASAAGMTSRIDGSDRYAVAVAVAEWFVSSGPLTWDTVGVASKLPDALTGGATLGVLGGPILFTAPDTLPASTGDTIAAHAGSITNLRILGGTGSVSPAVESQIRSRLGL